MLNLFLSGIDRTSILRAGTLSVETQLNSRDQADFTIVSTDGSFRPAVGQPVIITDAGTTTSGTAATFTRASAATVDGVDYTSGTPRYQSGVWIEESTINQFLNTDGLLATYSSGNVTQAGTALSGFGSSVQYGDNSVVRFAYKGYTHTVGVTYTFSAYVQMDDGGVPVVGAQTSGADFTIVNHGGIVSTLSNCVVELVSGSLYRVSITRAATSAASSNNGIVKYTQNSTRGFRIAGYQLELKGYRTSYAESGATAATRNTETLTIPTAGLNASSWTATLTATRKTRGLPAASNDLWLIQADANNLWRLALDANGVLQAIIISGGMTYTANTGATLAYNTSTRIAWSVVAGIARVAVNGAQVAEFAYVEPVQALPASIAIGGGVSAVYRDVGLNTRWLDGDQLERLTASTPEWVTSAWSLTSSLSGLDAMRVFGGTIESFDEMLTIGGQVSLEHAIRAVSWDALMDNRLVARAYDSPGQTLRDIVLDIIANEFAAEGINTDNVTLFGEIQPVKFNYDKASEALDILCELSGCSWWIDPYKKLYVAERAAILCPLNFLESAPNWRSISVERTRTEYRNRQYIKAGLGLTPLRTEYFVGDGTRKSFTLAYPSGKEPNPITVASVVKTVGIREVESGKNWYWQKNSPVINQDDGDPAVGAGVAITVTYQGQYPILVSATDDSQLSERASIEGGSGQYDHIEDEPNIDTVEAAQDRAYGLLRKYARIFQKATIATMSAGVRAGELTTLDIPTHGLTGQWLVEQTSIRDFNGQRVEYSMRVLDGESVGGWQGFFGALRRQARKVEFQDNEVILLLRSQPDTIVFTDSQTQSTAAPTAPLVGIAICGYSELTS